MAQEADHPEESGFFSDPSTELSSNRTAMSFERTAMSSDRTLMSVVRTSLSLIGFGFTIYQFFHSLNEELGRVGHGTSQRFALILITLGMLLLALGIWHHLHETRARRNRRARLYRHHLIRNVEKVKPSSVLVIAILLFVAGLLAFLRVGFTSGPL
jgi:putative membrane protein